MKTMEDLVLADIRSRKKAAENRIRIAIEHELEELRKREIYVYGVDVRMLDCATICGPRVHLASVELDLGKL